MDAAEKRKVAREIARERAKAKLRTMAAIRKEWAASHAAWLKTDERIEAYVSDAIKFTLDWVMGLENRSPTRVFATGRRIAEAFLGSQKEYESRLFRDDPKPGTGPRSH
jgi:hypothetical protein